MIHSVGIIGLGLMGGSIGLGLKNAGFSGKIYGLDQDPIHEAKAEKLGLVDHYVTLESMLEKASLIILAVPLDASEYLLDSILEQSPPSTVIMDIGSTKQSICAKATRHLNREQFVATHPMAGTEYAGPEAAKADLYQGKVAILCNTEESSAHALSVVRELYEILACSTIEMDAEEHDKQIALVSHLSHISSFALAKTALNKEKDHERLFHMAGSGFASTVRLAKSNATMWEPIFRKNKNNIKNSLALYIKELEQWQKLLNEDRFEELITYINNCNQIIPILEHPNPEYNETE